MCPFQIWAKSRQTKGIAAGGIAAENAAGAIIRSPLLPANAAKKQPSADETVSLEEARPMCPKENRHGPPATKTRFSGLFDPEISGGLFLDSGLSRLKMGATSNCGVVSAVGWSPSITQSTHFPSQSALDRVSIPEVPHAVVSPAVHRPHMCRRHEANAATPVRRPAAQPRSVDGP
jgi:hypothetical protein